jgi:hypothetical protein
MSNIHKKDVAMTPTYDIAPTLRPKQIKALNVLMDGGTIEQAAKAARVSHEGVQFWLYRYEPFRQAYDEQRRALLNEIGTEAPTAIVQAVKLLAEIFEYGEQEDENRRPDLALKLVQSVVSKGTNINFNLGGNTYDQSQNLTVNGQGSGPPLDAQQLDPATIGAFVEALRSAALADQSNRDSTEGRP